MKATAFVREVVLPGLGMTEPRIDPSACGFALESRPSRIHGLGLFANEDIPSGRFVIEYTGEIIGEAEADRRSFRENVYIFALDDEWSIDGAIGGSGAERINHSCRPNLAAVNDGRRIRLISLRAIAAGEELTLDYRLDDEFPPACSCGEEDCSGVIDSPFAPSIERR